MAQVIDVYIYRCDGTVDNSGAQVNVVTDVAHVGVPVASIASFQDLNSLTGTNFPVPGVKIYGKIIFAQGQSAFGNLQEAIVMDTVAGLIAKANA